MEHLLNYISQCLVVIATVKMKNIKWQNLFLRWYPLHSNMWCFKYIWYSWSFKLTWDIRITIPIYNKELWKHLSKNNKKYKNKGHIEVLNVLNNKYVQYLNHPVTRYLLVPKAGLYSTWVGNSFSVIKYFFLLEGR